MDKGISVTKTGKCVVLTMNRGENRFNFEFIEAMNRALDKVERYGSRKLAEGRRDW